MPKAALIEKLPDGRKAIILDERIDAAFLLTVGDTDGNGKQGLRALGLVDIPWDDDKAPRALLDSGEVHVDPKMLGERTKEMLGWVADSVAWMMPTAK